MAASDKSVRLELSRKQKHQLARIVQRSRKWSEGIEVKESIAIGQIPVKLRACLVSDGKRIRSAEVSISTPSKDGFHKKVLAGPVGELLRQATGDPSMAAHFFPKLARAWAKGDRQLSNTSRRLAKLSGKLNVKPEQLLALVAEAEKTKKAKAKKSKSKKSESKVSSARAAQGAAATLSPAVIAVATGKPQAAPAPSATIA